MAWEPTQARYAAGRVSQLKFKKTLFLQTNRNLLTYFVLIFVFLNSLIKISLVSR